jgi:hypothetical protein
MQQKKASTTNKEIHSFAKQVLDFYKRKIFVNKNQILQPQKKPYYPEPSNLDQYIIAGQEIYEQDENEIYDEISLETLRKTGLVVTSTKGGWRKKQQKYYSIVPKKSGTIEVNATTISNHKIEHDPYNKRVRGIGENFADTYGKTGRGKTHWVYYDKQYKQRINISYASIQDAVNALDNSMLGLNEETKPVYITDLPVMVTNENQLLCIPWTTDPPTIIITGTRGGGKTWNLHSILGRVYYNNFETKKDNIVGIINDSQDICYDWGVPWGEIKSETGWIKELSRFGEEPKPLPTINFYLSAPELQMRYAEEGIDFRLPMSMKTFLSKPSYFTEGIDKWKFDKTERYIEAAKEHLARTNNSDEIRDIIERSILLSNPNQTRITDGQQSMISKFVGIFNSIYSEQFTDNLFTAEPTTSAEWELQNKNGEKISGHPFIIAMEAGLIPIINSSQANHLNYYRNYMGNLLHECFEWQKNRKRQGKQNRMWIFIDEIRDFYKAGTKDNVMQEMEIFFAQGRNQDIAVVLNHQEYDQLTQNIRSNINYCFTTTIQRANEQKLIASDYKLSKDQEKKLGDLKTFEFMAMAKPSYPWILYDSYGNRKQVNGGVFRGKVLCPLTTHSKPGEVKQDEEPDNNNSTDSADATSADNTSD